jgi:hypothetical protein
MYPAIGESSVHSKVVSCNMLLTFVMSSVHNVRLTALSTQNVLEHCFSFLVASLFTGSVVGDIVVASSADGYELCIVFSFHYGWAIGSVVNLMCSFSTRASVIISSENSRSYYLPCRGF